MATDTPKLDIFRVLAAIDKKDGEFLSTLSPEEVKAYQPFLAMRWMTGTSDALQIYLTNEFVNPYAFALSQHKSLMSKLMAVASSGKRKKYTWVKQQPKVSSKPVSVSVLQATYGCNITDAIDALALMSVDDILGMADDLGYQQDDIQKITKEWKQK